MHIHSSQIKIYRCLYSINDTPVTYIKWVDPYWRCYDIATLTYFISLFTGDVMILQLWETVLTGSLLASGAFIHGYIHLLTCS